MPVDTKHTNFPGPSDETIVWRYSSLPKLLSLLATKKMFFATLRTLQKDDPFEGMQTLQSRRFAAELSRGDVNAEAFFRASYPAVDHEKSVNFKDHFVKILDGSLFSLADMCFVSCWHARPRESAALWKLYAENQAGVALKSSVIRLIKSLDSEKLIILGNVKYVDFDNTFLDTGNMLTAAFTKRDSYEHEHEVRLLHLDPDQSNSKLPGISIDCDPVEMIEEIVVSPYSDDWMVATVAEVVRRMGFPFRVRKSRLMDTSL